MYSFCWWVCLGRTEWEGAPSKVTSTCAVFEQTPACPRYSSISHRYTLTADFDWMVVAGAQRAGAQNR